MNVVSNLATVIKQMRLYSRDFKRTVYAYEGGRRRGRQKKRWEDKIKEWTGLEFANSQRAVEDRKRWREGIRRGGETTPKSGQGWSSPTPRGMWRQGKMERAGCKVVNGAPTILTGYGKVK